jgi:hypothetical protein
VATAERAVRTAAQVGIGCVTANAASIVGAATLLSVLMSVAASSTGTNGPGLTEELPPAPVVPAPEVAP